MRPNQKTPATLKLLFPGSRATAAGLYTPHISAAAVRTCPELLRSTRKAAPILGDIPIRRISRRPPERSKETPTAAIPALSRRSAQQATDLSIQHTWHHSASRTEWQETRPGTLISLVM